MCVGGGESVEEITTHVCVVGVAGWRRGSGP